MRSFFLESVHLIVPRQGVNSQAGWIAKHFVRINKLFGRRKLLYKVCFARSGRSKNNEASCRMNCNTATTAYPLPHISPNSAFSFGVHNLVLKFSLINSG